MAPVRIWSRVAGILGLAAITSGCDQAAATVAPPTTGSIEFRAATVGINQAPSGYIVEVQPFTSVSRVAVEVPLNGSATISGLAAGVYLMSMPQLVPNCEPVVQEARTVIVSAGESSTVALDVMCGPPQQIAFVNVVAGNSDIYVINTDGSGASRLTTDPAPDINPAWSPDGSKIAFASERDGNFEIYVMSADGTNPVRLTKVAGADTRPAWSPDGSRIAFVSERDGTPHIYVMNADGSNPVRLTGDVSREGDPAWSPDGRKIAFVSYRDGSAQIYTITPGRSDATQLTYVFDSNAQPVWSPDGTRIAFAGGSSFAEMQIAVMSADGAVETAFSQFGPAASNPSWSTDGRKILFTSSLCDDYTHDEGCVTLIQVVRSAETPYTIAIPNYPTEATWRP